MLMAFGKGNLRCNIGKSFEVKGFDGTINLLAVGVEINQPIIANFQSAWSFGEFFGERRGDVLPRTDGCVAKSHTNIKIGPGIVFEDQNIADIVFQNEGINSAEARVKKQSLLGKMFKIARGCKVEAMVTVVLFLKVREPSGDGGGPGDNELSIRRVVKYFRRPDV